MWRYLAKAVTDRQAYFALYSQLPGFLSPQRILIEAAALRLFDQIHCTILFQMIFRPPRLYLYGRKKTRPFWKMWEPESLDIHLAIRTKPGNESRHFLSVNYTASPSKMEAIAGYRQPANTAVSPGSSIHPDPADFKRFGASNWAEIGTRRKTGRKI